MKAALFLTISLIFGIIILGLATLHGSMLALSIPLLAYLFMAILQRPESIELTVVRELSPDHAPEGTPLVVKVTVTNQGRTIDELLIEDRLPGGIKQLGGKSSAISLLAPQANLELEYTVAARRGEYNAYELLVYARDTLGLFELPVVYRTVPRLIVQPRYPKLDRIKIRPPQTRGFAGPIAARQGGTGIGFWDLREYQAGDPQRQINWKRTARSERALYTNVFEQERVADVGLILDARLRANVTTRQGSVFEYSVRAAAALAENFLDDGNRVSLLVYGSEIGRVFPGYGRIQRNRILKVLSKTNPGMNYALESLEQLPTRFFPTKSQIVMVSTLLSEDIPVILRMRAQGYAVLVISPDPVSFEAAAYQDSSGPAYRIAYAERSLMLRQVRRCGVPIVNWIVDQPLQIAIRETLARQPLVNQINRVGQ